MSDQQSPETWIGRNVMIARASSTEAELVLLQNLNEQGVVCTYVEAEVTEPVLLPWGSVSWLRLAALEEESEVEEGSQPSQRAVSPEE